MRPTRRLGYRTLPPAAAHFRAYVRLRSVDSARNRDRSYTLTWTPALVDEGGALLRVWAVYNDSSENGPQRVNRSNGRY
jgi:hypothetical protein